jgi:hypothetical protein
VLKRSSSLSIISANRTCCSVLNHMCARWSSGFDLSQGHDRSPLLTASHTHHTQRPAPHTACGAARAQRTAGAVVGGRPNLTRRVSATSSALIASAWIACAASSPLERGVGASSASTLVGGRFWTASSPSRCRLRRLMVIPRTHPRSHTRTAGLQGVASGCRPSTSSRDAPSRPTWSRCGCCFRLTLLRVRSQYTRLKECPVSVRCTS